MVVIRRIKRATSRKPKVLKRSTVAQKRLAKKAYQIKPLSPTQMQQWKGLKKRGFRIATPWSEKGNKPAVGMTRSAATSMAKTYRGGGNWDAKVIRHVGGHAVIVRDT